MEKTILDRYSRHILLPQIDIAGQNRLKNSRTLIIGLGGLGSPASLYLAGSGIGHLVICDHDHVETSNLQRQIIHTTPNIGQEKTLSAQQSLLALNPHIKVTTINKTLCSNLLHEQTELADIVIDACDNFDTRYEVNAACVKNKTPLVSGAATHFTGQVTVFDNRTPDSPCYQCLYADRDAEQTNNCNTSGVLAPLTGIIGSIQATEAIKTLLGIGDNLCGRLLIVDSLDMRIRTIDIKKDPSCPICKPEPSARQ